MRTVKFSVMASKVGARKAALAAAGKLRTTDELRNRGTTRTAAKRALLDQTEIRAEAAGVTKVVSYR